MATKRYNTTTSATTPIKIFLISVTKQPGFLKNITLTKLSVLGG